MLVSAADRPCQLFPKNRETQVVRTHKSAFFLKAEMRRDDTTPRTSTRREALVLRSFKLHVARQSTNIARNRKKPKRFH